MKEKTEIKSFKIAHPVGQSRATGKWGWERVCDCLNLSRCIYGSKKAAEMARARAAESQLPMSKKSFGVNTEPLPRP